MPEISVEIKKISIKDLAIKMEEMNVHEEERLKWWEEMSEETKTATQSIISDMLIGMTKDFSWVPMAIEYDPNEKTYLDVNFKIMISETVARAIEERQEELRIEEEARTGVTTLLKELEADRHE